MLEITTAILLTVGALIGLAANIVGLPGNWWIVAQAIGCWFFAEEDSRLFISIWSLSAIVLVAMFGELLEFAAGALGASRLGGSKRGTALAIVGSIGGALLGLIFGNLIPIPIIGPVIASLLLGASGAFAGAVTGERWAGKEWEQSLDVGSAAFWGRLLGTVGKVACGTVVCGLFLLAQWW